MNKLTKTATALDKVFRIAEIVLMALAIAAAVCVGIAVVGYVLKLDPDTLGNGYESIDLGFLELELGSSFVPNKWLILLQITVVLTLSGITALLGSKAVQSVRAILKPMTQGQPFDGAVSIHLKKLSVLSIVIGILANIAVLTEEVLTVFAYDLTSLLVTEKIVNINANYTFDVTFLLFSAFLMLLSYVFSYGEELQTLSDETL